MIGRAHDDVLGGMIVVTMLGDALADRGGNKPLGIRELARRPVSMMAISNSMMLPYEAIRRHTAKLMKQGKCVRVGRNGLIVPAAAFRKMTLEAGTVVQLVFDFMDELRASGIKV